MNKKSTFLYLMWCDLFIQLGIMLFSLAIIMVLRLWLKDESTINIEVLFVTINGYLVGRDCFSLKKQNSFFTFQFSRKRFYRYQIFLGIIRAVVLAFVRAIYQYGMQDEFIKYIFEDAEEGITYSVPFIELLLTNICIFTLVNICYLILNTFTINSSLLKVDNEELSPQLKLRMERRKEKHPKVYTIKVIVTVVVKQNCNTL